MLTRLCCVFFLLVSPAAAQIQITSDTTIDATSPVRSYEVDSGTLTVNGATVALIEVNRHGATVVNDGIVRGGMHESMWSEGDVVVNGGEFIKPVHIDNGLFQVFDGHFDAEILALDSGGGGTIETYGGEFQIISSGVVDGFGGSYTFNIHGGYFEPGNRGVSRGYGSGTTINIFGTEFEKTSGFIQLGDPTYPFVRVTGYLEDGNWFDFMSLGPFRGTQPINGDFYVLHDTGIRRPLLGDANGDSVVDLGDLNTVRNNFGSPGEGDMDDNGVVDLGDLNAVRNNFGAFRRTPPLNPVPEPASLLLAMFLVPMCLYMTRRSSRYFRRQRS